MQSKGLSRVFSSITVEKHHLAFFTVQLSPPYLTTGKIIALTKWTFVNKIMSLLFNMLSRLVITFLPRSKCLLAETEDIKRALLILMSLKCDKGCKEKNKMQ